MTSDYLAPAERRNGHHIHAQRVVDVQEIERLQLDNKRLRNENQLLRDRLRYSTYHVFVAQQIKADALQMAQDVLAGLDVSREAMDARRNMSRRRWEKARAALRAANCADGYNRLMVLDVPTIQRRLGDLVERIEAAGNWGEVIVYLPRARRREYRRY